MPSQSISQPCCLCGWQMTELDVSVIRWGKISFLSPSRSLTHALFLCCVWIALSPLWCRSVCEVCFFSYIFASLAIFHPSTSSFHDTRPFHFSSPLAIASPVILVLLQCGPVLFKTCLRCDVGLTMKRCRRCSYFFFFFFLSIADFPSRMRTHLSCKLKISFETLAADAKAGWIYDYMRFFHFKASQSCYLLYICLIYN